MIIRGSLNYTTSGRRKKQVRKQRKKVEVTKNYVGPDTPSWRNNTNYSSVSSASHGLGTTGGKESEAYKEERRAVSSKYTIAPAYNQGAYQVIGEDSTKDIGR